MRRTTPGLTRPAIDPHPPTIERTADGARVWCKPAGGRETWEVIVRRADAIVLTDLIVRIAWDLRLPVDTAEALAQEMVRMMEAS